MIVAAHSDSTIFTRFIPLERPGDGAGTWKQYYERWASMTIDRLGRDLIGLVPELDDLVPPWEIVDKRVYSPWLNGILQARLQARRADTLLVTGGETDVCVLATILGYRIVIATDALCSSSDEAHEASLRVYHTRYGQQVETATTDDILSSWKD